ncbi:peroxiredoxin [Chitinophaga sp. S165]|uniref:peroxiredoxin family protein n=1 Tax=Chitinophaga sp. S165 TaxID=2135462 RepID=UPI000D715B56|nr:thioredoxin fold domain-containing protein [Chitinophaga sp. S165]PWV47096.1 thioredoxin-like protein [Chitinophaga sp. S165]
MKRIYISLIYICCGCYVPGQDIAHKGEPIPLVNLFLVDSVSYWNTSKIEEGKRTLVLMYRPSCPYSRTQIQYIIDDIEEFKDSQIIVVTTSAFGEMKKFSERYALTRFSNVKVGLDYQNGFLNYFEVQTVPYIAIYDANNKLVNFFDGLTPVKRLKE